MALSRSRLTDNVVNVAAGTTTDAVTVASNKKVFVKSILAHNVSTATTCKAHVYYVPNGSSVADTNRIFSVSLEPEETAFLEPSYPITFVATGDKISVGSENVGLQINFLVNGDKEA